MSKITVAFIKAAMVYFVLAMLLGIHMSRTGAVYPSMPVHVHFNLLGWISMMIYGVAYHILPRFSGQPLWSEKLATWHFWLANIGLIGMVVGWIIIGQPGGGTVLYIFALVEGVSVILFALNMFNTVKAAPATPPRPPVRPRPKPSAVKAAVTPSAPKAEAETKPKAKTEAKASEETPSATTAKAKKRPATKPKKKAKPAEKKSAKTETKKEAAPVRASATTIELAETKEPKEEEVKTEEPKIEASPVAETESATATTEPLTKPEQEGSSSAEETDKKPEPEATEAREKSGPE